MTTPGDYAKFLMEALKPSAGNAFRLTRRSLNEMLRPQVTVSTNDEYYFVGPGMTRGAH